MVLLSKIDEARLKYIEKNKNVPTFLIVDVKTYSGILNEVKKMYKTEKVKVLKIYEMDIAIYPIKDVEFIKVAGGIE